MAPGNPSSSNDGELREEELASLSDKPSSSFLFSPSEIEECREGASVSSQSEREESLISAKGIKRRFIEVSDEWIDAIPILDRLEAGLSDEYGSGYPILEDR